MNQVQNALRPLNQGPSDEAAKAHITKRCTYTEEKALTATPTSNCRLLRLPNGPQAGSPSRMGLLEHRFDVFDGLAPLHPRMPQHARAELGAAGERCRKTKVSMNMGDGKQPVWEGGAGGGGIMLP